MTKEDRQARFDRVAIPHLDAAYNLARWLSGNAHDAEDITQEAFLRAFRFFEGFRGDDARAWILKIVRNTYYTEWRRGRGQGDATEFDEDFHSPEGQAGSAWTPSDASPESAMARKQEMGVLDRALRELPAEYREAIVLREVEDLSYKEIAAALDVPMGTVMSRLARARRLLLDTFLRLGGERGGAEYSRPASVLQAASLSNQPGANET